MGYCEAVTTIKTGRSYESDFLGKLAYNGLSMNAYNPCECIESAVRPV